MIDFKMSENNICIDRNAIQGKKGRKYHPVENSFPGNCTVEPLTKLSKDDTFKKVLGFSTDEYSF